MFVIMGATGHVGRAVADTLLSHGEEVLILTRKPNEAEHWSDKGASIAEADAEDGASLRAAFQRGKRAFLLNPPADPTGDTSATERRTISSILSALDGLALEKVVAASTYGAQPGEGFGDLATLWQLEEGLRSQPIPAAINRGAYYMTNWLGMVDAVKASGNLPSMFPADVEIPMVAPVDLGKAAADRLLSSPDDVGVRYVEGPTRYTPEDVAAAFAVVLSRDVGVQVAPREQWVSIYKGLGFSDEAAGSYAGMTGKSLDDDFDKPEQPERGTVTLQAFISGVLSNK
ncbi:NmrA family NAD(P)-binding protein [Sphingobium sp. UBA5915]|uniref:NmrA family NAD(P)-binding protein n=1 Tax=Sphingobium sp. UBA5915 TaxID=1947530 RepID=UPI0025E1102F|nr:NmrA family NAD(P)-binding protein [Sphingobium sp. UBA5915]